MSAARAKIFGDLRRERWRFLPAVLAIAVGVAGFATVLASYAVLGREIDRGYRASAPASATFRLDAPVDRELLAAIAAQPGVARAEARRQLSGEIAVEGGKPRRLRLFAIADFAAIGVSRLESEEGAWPPGPGEILIERDAFQVLRGAIGDDAAIETEGGGRGRLRVAGRVKDVGQAQARMEHLVYGYVTPAGLASLGLPPDLDQVNVLARGGTDEAQVSRVVAGIEELLRQRGIAILRVEVPPGGRHPHAELMDMLLLAMAVFGFFLLLLGGVVVASLMSGLMATQVRQVAVMKVIGGSPLRIASIYAAEAAAIGAAALALGLPGGLAGSRALSLYLSRFLNFDIASFALPPWVPALIVLVGLGVPLFAAAWPIGRALARPPLAALADHGAAAPGFGGSAGSLLARLPLPSRLLAMALRNVLRRRGRLAATLSFLVASGVSFLSALHLRRSLIGTIDGIFAGRRYDTPAELAVARYSYDQHLLMIYVFLLVVAAILAAVGGLGIATATASNVLERRREIGILRAIGASPTQVRLLFVAEALAFALASAPPALLLALPASRWAGELVGRRLFPGGLVFVAEPWAPLLWLALVALLAVAASYLPSFRASRQELREALAYE